MSDQPRKAITAADWGVNRGGRPMKRKRLKKLMMSRGLSRNQANRILKNPKLKPPYVSNRIFWIVCRHEIAKMADACGRKMLRYFLDF